MDVLRMLFPPKDFSLVVVILCLPLIGAFINGVFGKRLGKEAVRFMALSAVGGSFVASLVAFLMLASASEESTQFTYQAWHWIDLSLANGHGQTSIDIGFLVDRLSSVMMLIITGVGFLIHVYAAEYMWDDSRADEDGGFHRFFAYLNLFIFAMLVLVMASSLPVLFVGWEGVGLCSYLLIGFWFSDEQNAAAGKKAFVVNRIGDFGLLCAMALLLYYTGALDWVGMGRGAGGLLEGIQVWPPGRGFLGPLSFLNRTFEPTVATVVGLFLFLGCAGKSAQIPLYVWLPDAMAGPTPVSALIHAATMVTAGIYLMCRMSGFLLLSPVAMAVMAFVGALTALFAATIGLVQNDIKKVLAYSTVSQLGYMFLGVGVGAFASGFFHVLTHAFFKACLFLGAGSVIHAMHAHQHDPVQAQDMRNMGGLRKWMPLTYSTFAVSCLAIAGIPPLSGFFSKDEILAHAVTNHIKAVSVRGEGAGWEAQPWFGWMLFGMGLTAAIMTAFYMFRALFMTFHGSFRGWRLGGSAAEDASHSGILHSAPEAAHAAGVGRTHGAKHGVHHEGVASTEPHESPRMMTWVLVILGVLAAASGMLNAGVISHRLAFLDRWLEPVFDGVQEFVREDAVQVNPPWLLALAGVLAGVAGIGIATWMYVVRRGAPADALAKALPGLHRLVLNKWRIDELYGRTVVAMLDAFSDTAAVFDKWVVDGILARLTGLLASFLGTVLRALQTGVVHAYAAMMVVGLTAMGWFFVWSPQVRAVITEQSNGQYLVEAAPGLGYSFRWHTRSLETPDTIEFGPKRTQVIDLSPGEEKKFVLEVRNAFDRTAERTFVLVRPPVEAKAPEQVLQQLGRLGADLPGQEVVRP